MPNSDAALISSRIRLALEHRSLNQVQLAQLTGYPVQSINRYVNGKVAPKLRACQRIAAALHVDMAWLIGDKAIDDIDWETSVIDSTRSEAHYLIDRMDSQQLTDTVEFIKKFVIK